MSRAKPQKELTQGLKTREDILKILYNDDFYSGFTHKTDIEKLEYFAQLGIIHNSCLCSCSVNMGLVKKKRTVDGYVWSCSRCRKERTCRWDSAFERFKSPMIKVFKSIQMFCRNNLQNYTGYDLSKSKNTITEWFKLIREIMQDHLLANPRLLGGLDEYGNKKIVEIDESLFFRRKYNRGRERPQQWVLGMVERGSKASAFFILPDRRATTIIPIIINNVLPNTIIITDCWAAYNRLREYSDYEHLSVNHSLNFLNPDDSSIHTQTIESTWGHCKKKLKAQNGTANEMLEGYLYEYAFKREFTKMSCFNNFLLLLKDRILSSHD